MGTQARQMLHEEKKVSIMDQSYIGGLVRKWGQFLEGIPTRTKHEQYVAGCTAMMFENQAQWLRGLSEETRSSNVGSFTKFIFPVLRRVFPNLIAHELVSVQPMNAPIGAIFFLEYLYANSKGGTVAGNIFPRDFDRDYSSEYINGEPIGKGDGTNFGGGGAVMGATLAWAPVRKLNAGAGYAVIIKEVTSGGVVVQTATDNGANAFTYSTGAITNAAGAINYSNGVISGFKFENVPANNNQIKAYYYQDGEASVRIPQVSMDIRKAPIEAQSRRLKAQWSAEAAEDLKAFHGIDAETELVSAIANEISMEIDREILNDLFQAATTTTGVFDRIPPAGIPELDHIRSIITTIATVSNLIHKRTLRAPANWIVTSPEISALISQLTTHGDFRPLWVSSGDSVLGPADMPRPLTQHGQFGIYKAGTLQNKWLLYEDPFFTADKMLVGLKGSSFLESGYVFAPYVPLEVSPTFLDPSDLCFKKALRTRYGRKLTRADYYGQISVSNL